MTRTDPSLHQDAWLAGFADQILNDEVDSPPADSPDPGMRALADTLLRLKRAFPAQDLDPASVKRMHARILQKWREEEQKKLRWPRILRMDWLTLPRRRQAAMAFAILAVAGVLIVIVPYLFSSGEPITASAGSEMTGVLAWIILGALIVFIGWLLRRKP